MNVSEDEELVTADASDEMIASDRAHSTVKPQSSNNQGTAKAYTTLKIYN